METAYVCGTRHLVFNRKFKSEFKIGDLDNLFDEQTSQNDDKHLQFTNRYVTYSENISVNISNFHNRYSGHIDEFILDGIDRHISVDYGTETSVHARKHAYGIVHHILDRIQEIEPRLKMKIIESGSFFSNLRVGMPYEFDFMLDITSTLSDGGSDYGYSVEKILSPAIDSNLNFDTFLYRIWPNTNNGIFENKHNYVDSIHVKKVIFGLFRKVIEHDDFVKKWKIHKFSGEKDTSGPAYQLSCYFKETAILMDLVPCLQFPESNARSELPQMQLTTEQLLKTLLGKDQLKIYLQNLPKKLYLVCKSSNREIEGLFRLSTSQVERDIYLNHLDYKFLQALKIAKYYFQIFFISYLATNEDTFGDFFVLRHNSHPFSSKSYLPSYAVTNLFFHFLKIVMCFPWENSEDSSSSKHVAMLFLNFVYNVIGHRMPLAISHNNRWLGLKINIHGWCFCHTNTIPVKFLDYMHSYFRNSMAEYIRVVQNISSFWEFPQFPLIGRKPEFFCVKCFDKNIMNEMLLFHTTVGIIMRPNTILLHFIDHKHSYFRNSMAEYIRVIQNILSIWESDQLPLIGRKPEVFCLKCFDKNIMNEMLLFHTTVGIIMRPCRLHALSHQKERYQTNRRGTPLYKCLLCWFV